MKNHTIITGKQTIRYALDKLKKTLQRTIQPKNQPHRSSEWSAIHWKAVNRGQRCPRCEQEKVMNRRLEPSDLLDNVLLCNVCGREADGTLDGCLCPECKVCKVTGDPDCYEECGLEPSKELFIHILRQYRDTMYERNVLATQLEALQLSCDLTSKT